LKVSYDVYDNFNNKFGHIFYKENFSHYLIRVEYRFVGDQVAGGPGWAFRNSGIMVHGQSAESMQRNQDFPISIEVQLLGGKGDGKKRTTCNLCTPDTHVEIDGKLVKRHCLNSTSPTFHGDQWVTAEVLVLGNEVIKHIINGDTVLSYEHPQMGGSFSDTAPSFLKQDGMLLNKGSISLQSESHPVEFRKVELLNLEDQFAPKNITVLKNANIVDVEKGSILKNQTLTLSNDKIEKIESSNDAVTYPNATTVIDLKGQYLMPGLIDAHVHIRDLPAAKRALQSGVTTARSMGVDNFMDVGMRELGATGYNDIPEIIAAGYHVRPKPADAFFLNFPQLNDLMGSEVRGEAAVKRMANALLSKNIDWIKTNATARAGLPHTDPREPYYNEKEMKALVSEGANKKVPVAAHAHGDEGGRAAVLGGAKSIEHGTYLSKETLNLMKEKGTYLVPTIAVVGDLVQPGGDYDNPLLMMRGRHMHPRIKETAKNAHEIGVKMVAATDTGYGKNSTLRMGLELEALVEIGMTNAEAIRAATATAAEMLMIQERTGTVTKGLDADLLILERNPLDNVGAVHDPLMVINNGKIVLNRIGK
jgi:imidazolonepropionase-like amidohydrolase